MLVVFSVGCGPSGFPGMTKFEIPSEDTCNFVQNMQGQRVSWKRDVPVGLWVHESVPTALLNSLYGAMAQWEYASGRPYFRILGIKRGPAQPAQDGESVIYWLTEWSTTSAREQARTTIHWLGDVIEEADIVINAKNHNLVSTIDISSECLEIRNGPGHRHRPASASSASCGDAKVDFESLMVHELGHVLGLQHNEDGGSVMARELPYNVLRSVPQRVDMDSIRCEYGM